MQNPNFYYENLVGKKGHKIIAGCDEVGRGSLAGQVVCGCVVFDKKSLLSMNRFIEKNNDGGVRFRDRTEVIRTEVIRIDDSKKLTACQREKAAKWIKKNCLVYGIGAGSVSEINKFGIVKATQKAFRRAINLANIKLKSKKLSPIDFLLIDAFYLPYSKGLRMPKKNIRMSVKSNFSKDNIGKNRFFRFAQNDKYPIKGNEQLAIINGDEKSISIAAASIVAKIYRDNLMIKLAADPKYCQYGWDKNKGYGTKVHIEAIKANGATKHHRTLFVSKFTV